MQDHNYNFEIRTLLTHFAAAFDGVEILRYDGKRYAKETIKVPLMYAPKSHIIADLIGVTDTVRLPLMAVEIKTQGRDKERVKNKLTDIHYRNEDGTFTTMRAVPWNIGIEMTILAKYQEDMDQIIQNFAVNALPYIVISWKEPKSGRELRTEILWDGNVSYTYSGKNQKPTEPAFRITAVATMTIKGYIFKTWTEDIQPICRIDTDYVFTDKFYCNYDTLVHHTSANYTDSYSITGRPVLRYVSPYLTQETLSPVMTIQGYGLGSVNSVYVSGSNPDMYPLATYRPFTALDSFDAYIVPTFTKGDNELTFTLPAPSADGFVDIIAVNTCGYGVMTKDANRCHRVENPYPAHMPEHYSWTVMQFPYINGVIVANYFDPWYVDSFAEVYEWQESAPMNRPAVITKIRQLMAYASVSASEL